MNKRIIKERSAGFALIRNMVLNLMAVLFLGICLLGCTDFVEVDVPENILVSETVFDDPVTVRSAMANIFFNMREQGMLSGNFGLTTLMGIYGDELDYYGVDPDFQELYRNTINADNGTVLSWWANAYSLVYSANDVIKGVEDSKTLDAEDKKRFLGQALFVRAYVHGLLASVYGDIPYITTTDYLQNNTVERIPLESVYEFILEDLVMALQLLEEVPDAAEERVLPDQWTVRALLARTYLYVGDWELALSTSMELIDRYPLEQNLSAVFLKNSPETIWQFKPGENPKNTQEANQLIIQLIPGQTFALTENLVSSFEEGDLRETQWTDSISDAGNTLTLYYAHKYKALFTETASLEYSILFRVSEQYLIAAEAMARLGDITGAQQYLNSIRNRAGLASTTAATQEVLLGAILQERQVELFAEFGHRWFDLKRTGSANEVLGAMKPGWQATDILFPIPEAELEINPNLLPQNEGY